MKKRLISIIAALSLSLTLSACNNTDPTGSDDIAVGSPPTEYTNENGVTFRIMRGDDVWDLAEKFNELSEDKEKSDELFIQMDMIISGTNASFKNSNGTRFSTYVLTDMADGTPRRMEIQGIFLKDAEYGDKAYASGATLDESTYTALDDLCDTFNEGDRVTVRGKLTGTHFTKNFSLGKGEYAQRYEVYLAVMEIEPKKVSAVHLGEVNFEAMENLSDLWAACEMNEQYVTALPGYPSEPCYVELELEVSENLTVNENTANIGFTPLDVNNLPDGSSGRIDLNGVIYKHTESVEDTSLVRSGQLIGATVDESTYNSLVKKCKKLKVGQKVVVKGCLVTSYLEEAADGTQFYNTSLAIIGIEVK